MANVTNLARDGARYFVSRRYLGGVTGQVSAEAYSVGANTLTGTSHINR